MVTFKNGPAAGRNLQLRRAPFFLRVVIEKNQFDALDQLSDEPTAGETLHAYVLTSPPGMCHIYMGGGRGGFYAMAEYVFVQPQPDDGMMRNNDAWEIWCNANAERFGFSEMKKKLPKRRKPTRDLAINPLSISNPTSAICNSPSPSK